MKKLLTLIAVLALSVASFAQKKESRSVDTFTQISFRTPGKVYVKQGSPQKVEIEGSREVLEKIETRVDGDKLIIGPESDRWFNWSWGDSDRVTVYITVASLSGVSVSGSGTVIGQSTFTASRMNLNVSGSGTLEIAIDASDVDADVSGSGNMIVTGKCRSFNSDISGSGDIELNATVSGEVSFDISGSGKAIAEGSASSLEVEVTGSGKVLAAALAVNSCKVRISGSGDVETNVKDNLDARISGSGTVRYKGDPAHVNSNASGSGSVRKM